MEDFLHHSTAAKAPHLTVIVYEDLLTMLFPDMKV